MESEFELVGIFTDGQSLSAAVPELKPNVIVLDVGLPLMTGFEVGKRIKKSMRSVRIVYLTINTDIGVATEAFRAGASGYLLKTSVAAELALAVREVLQGKLYISPLITKDVEGFFLVTQVAHRSHEELSNREREVLQLLAQGKSMREVAYILKVTPRTVAFHKYNIMRRLHLRTSAELVQYAIREHIISLPKRVS
jgi:DNA-binding NarL/FixJ family response regulator